MDIRFVLAIFSVFICFGLFMNYLNTRKNIALNRVRSSYTANSEFQSKYYPEPFYIWCVGEERGCFNTMLVSSNEKGLIVKGGVLFFWVKEILIPWSDLELSEKIRPYISKKQTFFIKSLNVYVAVSLKHSQHMVSN
ncbi:hypothetical protein [Shewanella atlantica]|uniref:hypothetical protein n=1 Tax=Shewanella atlantica TaxID=271099 RepID=UPI0037365231